MKIFAISDLHIATTTDKPMDIFGSKWVGYLDKIKLEDIALYEKNMQQHLQEEGIKVLDHLRKTNELTFQVEKELSVFISNFTKDFIENLGYDKSEKN